MIAKTLLFSVFEYFDRCFDPRYQVRLRNHTLFGLFVFTWGCFFLLSSWSEYFLFLLSVGLCVLLLALIYFIFHLQQEIYQTNQHFSICEKRLKEKYHRLAEQTRLLATIKEVGRVVNDDTHLENILEKVFSLLEQVACPEEIVVWLYQEQQQKLLPRAQRRNLTSLFQEDLHLADLDDTLVNECFQHQKVFRYAEGAFVHLCFPLVADNEALGVLTTTLLTKGSELQKLKQLQEFEEDFVGLLKHLSLAIKKPTLYDRAVLDGLTGLFTKRHIQTQFTAMFHQAKRSNTPLSLILFDIDHFKKVNDQHGHVTGDIVLQQVSQILKQNLRRSDSAYRYGGEELMVLLPGAKLEAATLFADRIRQTIEKKEFDTEHPYKLRVTISIGVCEFHPDLTDYLQMISRADQGLYLAKNSGRNRIGIYRKNQPELAA